MPRARVPIAEGQLWLGRVIGDAKRLRACAQMHCSTCGAIPLRGALWGSAEFANPGRAPQEIAKQLSYLEPPLDVVIVRFIIFELWRRVGSQSMASLVEIFDLSPAWTVYHGMVLHHAAATARYAENMRRNDPAQAALRRAVRAAAHAERLKAKALRDAERAEQVCGPGQAMTGR